MWQKVQTYVFVTLIAVLIWLYAEGLTLKTWEITPDIEFVPPPGQKLLISPARHRIQATIKGPTAQLDEIKKLQEAGPIKLELLDDPTNAEPYEQVNLAQELARQPAIARLGVTITDIKPARVRVRVERYVTRTLAIEIGTNSDFEFKGDPTVDPAEATVEVPMSLAGGIDDDTKVIALLDDAVLTRLEMDKQHIEENVPLILPPPLGGEHIIITPQAASVTLTITQKTSTTAPQSVPVLLVAPIAELAKYEVLLENQDDQMLRGVVLSGPNDVIDGISARQIKVWAELRLSADDLAQAAGKDSNSAPVHMSMPAGITVVEPPQPIKYKVVKKP